MGRLPNLEISADMYRPQAGGYKVDERLLKKFSWQFDRSPQEAQIMVPRNLDSAELLQVRRKPLRVEQHEFASAQMLHQRYERNLGSVSHPMKHRFSKESSSNRDAVKAAGEPACLPGFDGMRMAELMQSCVAVDDLAIDPSIFPFRACSNHFGKGLVDCCFKYSLAQ